MAGLGYLLYTAGQVLTAAQVNGYLMQQSNMVFATSAARDSALTSIKAEGMESYQLDSNTKAFYTGTSTTWSTVGPVHGAWTSWTPTCDQNASVTLTNNASTYMRIGRDIQFRFVVTATTSGTASNVVRLSLPVTAAGIAAYTYIGVGDIHDSSANNRYPGILVLDSSTQMKYRSTVLADPTSSFLGVAGAVFSAALANTDILCGQGSYEAAGDA